MRRGRDSVSTVRPFSMEGSYFLSIDNYSNERERERVNAPFMLARSLIGTGMIARLLFLFVSYAWAYFEGKLYERSRLSNLLQGGTADTTRLLADRSTTSNSISRQTMVRNGVESKFQTEVRVNEQDLELVRIRYSRGDIHRKRDGIGFRLIGSELSGSL